jgi:sulfite reductase (NADPH) flavoprotein alpha-component
MLAEPKLKTLLDLISHSTKDELIWMNGYLSGLLTQAGVTQEAPVPGVPVATKPSVAKITIVYGTETGNSKRVATDFASKAKKIGITPKLVSLDQYRLTDLPREEYFLAVISTQGDGEPPAAAKKFYDHIHLNGFKFDKLKYSVLALGDTSYPLFCKAGEDVDAQLQKLGGKRIAPLQKCDTEFDEDANQWFASVLQSLSGNENAGAAQVTVAPKKSSGKKTYTGTILTNVNLNDRGSDKETHHLEISAEGLEYLPGDSIGIVPENDPAVVDAILLLTGTNKMAKIDYRGGLNYITELLHKKLGIFHLPERVVKQYSAIVQQEIPATRIDLLDLLKIYPVTDSNQFEDVVEILEPITPRLYSIASSPEAHGGEIHLTVARDRFCVNDEIKYGICSDYLSGLPENTTFEFYVHKNNQFRLPAPDKDIILIGPGTGVAPFRSFLAERDATGAAGRNWLFFGDQHFASDFLYQTEMQNWVETGVLTRMNVAFSRDQAKKIYVQHRMSQHGADLYHWLESGAHLYICGAKDPMSSDVEQTLLGIFETFGNKSKEAALQFLDQLKEEGRYSKDVY